MMREQQENIMQNQISEQKARLEKRMRELLPEISVWPFPEE